ncbi:serine hydrolase domain-containing protein [Gemmatimonas sp.]|uniref:serine hydrolase domain-containing protein n=1 Tax=Gemmatimonas sp. TaxID=1962908 RepID=UPI002869F374|nr:serine hydrolase domain-containing protein [Gemmatimonas sp.]
MGVTSLADPLPTIAGTVCPIASISKTFAAAAMLRLVEQGKVDLDAPVRRYLPQFRVRDEAVSRTVTVRQLLMHAGGWEGQVSGPDRGSETLSNFVASISDLMQVAPPGAAWSFNNAGFSIAGRVIEQVTGNTIRDAMAELLLKPLGLGCTGTHPSDFITHRFAVGGVTRDGIATVQRPFGASTTVTAGGIGLCMTDLMTYARFHPGDGSGANGAHVVSRESLALMRTPQMKKQGTDDDMGLGWHLRTMGGVRTASHGGTLGGHNWLLEIVPERNFAIAVLTNSNVGWRVIEAVEREALRSYLGLTYAKNQAIAHRGVVETLPSATPLAKRPQAAPYVGTYARPTNTVEVREENGGVVVQVVQSSGARGAVLPIAFFGEDRAVFTAGADLGQSVEFVHDAEGRVQWVRVTGRVAVRVK